MIRLREKIAETIFAVSAIVCGLITVVIFGFMILPGIPLFREGHFLKLLTGAWIPHHGSYGIYPMIMGTLYISLLSIFIAFPLSVGCASLISILAPSGFGSFLRKIIQLMTGIPTVIYGFVGVFLLVPFVRELFDNGTGMCILSASLMLTMLISPTMILFFSDSFDQVPQSYLKVVDSLGGTKVQKLIYVVLPYAWRGLLTGFILGLGRALGDTMIALMIAGNAVRIPTSLLDSARTLTSHIALVFAADYESLEFKSIYACGLLLYLFTSIVVIIVRSLGSMGKEKNQ
ncbi:MAG: phosphate ABC transporter permease subunit PstC [bacterium]